jgi:hypothetical protein
MPGTLNTARHCHSIEITETDASQASWRKSSFSHWNGNCVEISRIRPGLIGMRDTKDHGEGPVLIFTDAEWDAFLIGAKQGQFDNLQLR